MARGAFWTIIVDEQPTAFRAPVREDLLPTLKQLHRQHPSATIKWFQRGRLWDTPGDAMDASKPPRRGADWRPGGEHKDPRAVYQVPRDVKRKRWAAQAADGRGPWVKGADRAPGFKPKGDKPWRPRPDGEGDAPRRTDAGRGEDRPRSSRPPGDRPAWRPKPDDRPTGGDRPRSSRPPGDKPAWRPKDDRAAGSERPRSSRPPGDKPAWRPQTENRGDGDRSRSFRPQGDKPAWRPKGDDQRPRAEGDRFSKPSRPRGDRPAGGDRDGWRPKADRPQGDRTGWRPAGDRPPRKPAGDGRPRKDFAPRSGGDAGAPRKDWRDDRRGPRDATPRSGDARPAPAAKKGRTWKVGELPPANRKRKKDDE